MTKKNNFIFKGKHKLTNFHKKKSKNLNLYPYNTLVVANLPTITPLTFYKYNIPNGKNPFNIILAVANIKGTGDNPKKDITVPEDIKWPKWSCPIEVTEGSSFTSQHTIIKLKILSFCAENDGVHFLILG